MSDIIIFLLFFAGVVLFFGLLFFEIHRVEKRAIAHGYGPKAQIGGKPCSTGQLVCVSVVSSKINRSISFDYVFQLYTDGTNVTGTYKYHVRNTTYSGEVFLSFAKNRVKGRSLMGGLSTVEGVVTPSGVRLTRGHPAGSFLKILNGPYEYSIRSGQIQFDKTTRAGNISAESVLRIDDNQLHGRVFHGPQKTWAVDVDVTYQGIKREAVCLAIVLACDDILRTHHSD
jgi:hypothetical protein